jgi:hypothetical protein
VAIISLVLSVLASLFLTLTFVRSSLSNDPAQDEPDSTTSQKGPSVNHGDEFLTVTDVNIRVRPGGLSEKVGLAEKGSRVRVVEQYKNWRRIIVVEHGRDKEHPDSEDEGWIDGDNLTALTDDRI